MQITPLSEHTGAEVTGIDLTVAVSDAQRRRLNEAFVEHSVLVVREQSLDPHAFVRAARLFGEVFQQHNTRFALESCPQVHYVSNQDFHPDGSRYIPGSGYHTDHSNDGRPPKATVLHAVELPDRGGDTQFVNMHEAYASLPPSLRDAVEGRQAVHVYQSRHSARKLMALPKSGGGTVPASVTHPLVRVHPQSGRLALYLNPIRIESIEGMEETEALELLDALLAHATRVEHEYRHQWRVGDLTLWDNRCLLHRANGDYDMAQRRYLYRLMLRDEARD